MSRLNRPNEIAGLGDLSRLIDLGPDKRQSQKASAKKRRRHRHFEQQFIRHMTAQFPRVDSAKANDPAIAATRSGTLLRGVEA